MDTEPAGEGHRLQQSRVGHLGPSGPHHSFGKLADVLSKPHAEAAGARFWNGLFHRIAIVVMVTQLCALVKTCRTKKGEFFFHRVDFDLKNEVGGRNKSKGSKITVWRQTSYLSSLCLSFKKSVA